jgi:HSP20 family protein
MESARRRFDDGAVVIVPMTWYNSVSALTSQESRYREVESMLMRTDPFRELDRLVQHAFGAAHTGTWSRPSSMPLDAYRNGDEFLVTFELPGVVPDAIDIDVERNVLTVKAERRPLELPEGATAHLTERSYGVFSRQLFLGDALDTDNIQASYDNGVLTVRIPVLEQAKPRKVQVAVEGGRKAINA